MRRAIVGLVCAALCAALPTSALAQRSPNGQLAVVLKDRVVTINSDGSAPRTVYAPGSGDTITDPAWSPDGNKLAFSYQKKIAVLDLETRASRFMTVPPADAEDSNPTWLADGTIAFRRVTSLLGIISKQEILRPDRDGLVSRSLDIGVSALALTPDLDKYAFRLGPALTWTGGGLDLSIGAVDTPAWSRAGTDLAYVEAGGPLPWLPGLRIITDVATTAKNVRVTDQPATAPRWAPGGDQLAYIRDGLVMLVAAAERATPVAVPNITTATAVDWQPCAGGRTVVGCASVLPPECKVTTAQVTTLADQPVELPAVPCTDPAGLPLHLVVAGQGEHGSVSGTVYTPRPGFVGQDTVTYRFSNGTALSELVRVTIVVGSRPAAPGLPPAGGHPPALTQAAPFVSLRVRPQLDRKRTTVARLSCDQACSISVRLEGRLRKKNKAVKGATVKRTLAAGRVLSLRLKLPAKPTGTLKTVYITGSVRGANGARKVKLPVTVRR